MREFINAELNDEEMEQAVGGAVGSTGSVAVFKTGDMVTLHGVFEGRYNDCRIASEGKYTQNGWLYNVSVYDIENENRDLIEVLEFDIKKI